jgi:hypothetical protein
MPENEKKKGTQYKKWPTPELKQGFAKVERQLKEARERVQPKPVPRYSRRHLPRKLPSPPSLVEQVIEQLVADQREMLAELLTRRELGSSNSQNGGASDSEQTDKQTAVEFKYSPDFRSVNMRGKIFGLTPTQAHVIEILFENWKQGTPDVSQAYILEQIHKGKIEGGYDRVRDVFKGKGFPENWTALVKKGEKKGTLRLNVADPTPGLS